MLTVNADDHPFMSPFHEWNEEKWMVVNRRDECERRTQAHLGLLTKPAHALFLKWAKGLAKSEYSW